MKIIIGKIFFKDKPIIYAYYKNHEILNILQIIFIKFSDT